MADAREGMRLVNGGDPTPQVAGAIVLLALLGVIVLRRLKLSVSASV